MDRELYNRKQTLGKRRALRGDPTPFEKVLWKHLRDSQTGFKFRRQQGIGSYIADFYCSKVKLVIEIDGDSHFSSEGQEHDRKRDEYMRANSVHILRFTNVDMQESLDGVIEQIIHKLNALAG
jgi:very-short-patch-repair endonuclease